jgi:hypothetical protein
MNFTPFVGLENYSALYNYHTGSTKEGMFADFIGPLITAAVGEANSPPPRRASSAPSRRGASSLLFDRVGVSAHLDE